MRLRTSRPNSSVPKRYGGPGARSRRAGWAIGSKGASIGAAAAVVRKPSTSTRPDSAKGRRTSQRAAPPSDLVIADAGIEVGVGHVDDEVDDDEGGGDEQHAALDQRVVA